MSESSVQQAVGNSAHEPNQTKSVAHLKVKRPVIQDNQKQG